MTTRSAGSNRTATRRIVMMQSPEEAHAIQRTWSRGPRRWHGVDRNVPVLTKSSEMLTF
jgi:hypothetical protein